MSRVTTIRVPTELIESAKELSGSMVKVRTDPFFSSAYVLSNGLNQTAILKWAMVIGLQFLREECVNAEERVKAFDDLVEAFGKIDRTSSLDET